MSTCSTDVITKAFDDLWTKGILENGRTRIDDIDRFNTLNKLYTETAKSKYGVTNSGTFFTVNNQSLHGGPLLPWNNGRRVNADFAVVNKSFTDEFQEKYDIFINQKQSEETKKNNYTQLDMFLDVLKKPFTFSKEERNNLRNDIEYMKVGIEKDNLLKELSEINSYESLGELLIKLCK